MTERRDFVTTEGGFSGLSNKATGFPLLVNGLRVPSSEHLFCALKYPDQPGVQEEILSHSSANSALLKIRKLGADIKTRSDWKNIEIDAMYYCLRAKLIWNWVAFGRLLKETGDREIVEISSRKDQFWGAVQKSDGFHGENHLGRLLMKLRDEYLGENNESLRRLPAPAGLGLKLMNREIADIDRSHHLRREGTRRTEEINMFRPLSLSF